MLAHMHPICLPWDQWWWVSCNRRLCYLKQVSMAWRQSLLATCCAMKLDFHYTRPHTFFVSKWQCHTCHFLSIQDGRTLETARMQEIKYWIKRFCAFQWTTLDKRYFIKDHREKVKTTFLGKGLQGYLAKVKNYLSRENIANVRWDIDIDITRDIIKM